MTCYLLNLNGLAISTSVIVPMSYNVIEFLGTSQNPAEPHGIPWNLREPHEIL
jgi:hypothetical protein